MIPQRKFRLDIKTKYLEGCYLWSLVRYACFQIMTSLNGILWLLHLCIHLSTTVYWWLFNVCIQLPNTIKTCLLTQQKLFHEKALIFVFIVFSLSRMVNIKSFWLSLIIIHHTLRVTEKGSSKYVIACQIINSIFSITLLSSCTFPLQTKKQKHFINNIYCNNTHRHFQITTTNF